jgi:hypothetical protein
VRAGALALAVALLGACGREAAFPDRTARLTLDGRTTTFEVDGCLLDGQTAYVVGRAEDGSVLQAVVGVEDDGATGVPASTGVDVDGAGDTPSVGAFGPEAWARRQGAGDPPGGIDTARIRGARIQASGTAQALDAAGTPAGTTAIPLALDARCDAPDQG